MSFDESVALWAGRAVVALTVLAAIAGLLAAVAGLYAWRFANRVAAAKEAQLTRFQAESKQAIAMADERAAAANLRAAQAHERAAASELETARLAALAAKERTARLALDQRTANRSIPAAERSAVSTAMSKFAGQRAEIMVFPVNFETVWLADTIYGILLNAKWDVAPPRRLSEPPKIPAVASPVEGSHSRRHLRPNHG